MHGRWTKGPARKNREAQEEEEAARQSSQEQVSRRHGRLRGRSLCGTFPRSEDTSRSQPLGTGSLWPVTDGGNRLGDTPHAG